jgi:hypothetical protein
MIRLGMRMRTYGTDSLVPQPWPAQPVEFPELPDGHYVVCGFGSGETERLFVAESFSEMEDLYASYLMTAATCIKWYTGHEEVGTIGGGELLKRHPADQ